MTMIFEVRPEHLADAGNSENANSNGSCNLKSTKSRMPQEGIHMLDLIYVAVGLVFFAGCWLLVKACVKL